jgi:hypothetical protein
VELGIESRSVRGFESGPSPSRGRERWRHPVVRARMAAAQGSGPGWQSHEEEAPWPSVLGRPISSARAQASKGRKGDLFFLIF